MQKASKPILSIVILNYNTRDLTVNCINSLLKVKRELNFEIILSDNGSVDDSVEAVGAIKDENRDITLKIVENKANLGFAKGNNAARSTCSGDYILFLNSDTLMNTKTLKESVEYLKLNPNVGAMTVKTILPDGKYDRDARRSFPTPWIALTHFSGLDKLFPKSKLFSQYWYGYVSPEIEQEIDVLQGAYFLSPKKVLDQVDWFSEEYFLDGEDIDLSWKIKHKGYKVMYYPKVSFIHLKKQTKKKVNSVFSLTGVESMAIFYKKFLWDKYPAILNYSVLFAIKMMKVTRNIKRLIFG